MSRKRWLAVDVNVFHSDLGVDLRDEFGPVGMCMWVGFLAACKRNNPEGKITYTSEAEALNLLGVPGMELVDEDGEPFKLDDFWTFLGRRKQTSTTRRKRLVYVTATKWEGWQKTAKQQADAERKAAERDAAETAPEQLSDSSGTAKLPSVDNNGTAHKPQVNGPFDSDENRTDIDLDLDMTLTETLSKITHSVTRYATGPRLRCVS